MCGDVTDRLIEFHQVRCLIWKFHAVKVSNAEPQSLLEDTILGF